MVEDRVVSRDEGLSLAMQLGCEYFETSAKSGLGVEPAFISMAEHIMCGGPRSERRKLLAARQRLLWARAAGGGLASVVRASTSQPRAGICLPRTSSIARSFLQQNAHRAAACVLFAYPGVGWDGQDCAAAVRSGAAAEGGNLSCPTCRIRCRLRLRLFLFLTRGWERADGRVSGGSGRVSGGSGRLRELRAGRCGIRSRAAETRAAAAVGAGCCADGVASKAELKLAIEGSSGVR